MTELIGALIEQGLLGLFAAVALYLAWRKDRQVEHLYGRMIEKTETRLEKYHELNQEMTKTLSALLTAIQEWERKR